MRHRLFSLLLTAVVLASCGPSAAGPLTTETSSRVLGPGEHWLPLANFGKHLCFGAGFIGLAWLSTSDDERKELAWPVGYSARFTPKLEILDAHGQVAAVAGQSAIGGCPIADTSVFAADFSSPRPDGVTVPDFSSPRH